MASSDFWRDLAAAFRALPDFWDREATYSLYRSQGYWQVDSGHPADFEAVAIRAGSAIADPSASDPLVAWLQRLMQEQDVFFESPSIVETSSGEKIQHVGRIPKVCKASFDLCKKLEVSALKEEFEEKQRNDPKNRPPLLQMYEAFKLTKAVVSGPKEKIPESVVRLSVAQQYGIKPEEVTLEQIIFAVSGILPDYPSIKLVPSELPAVPGPLEIHTTKPESPAKVEATKPHDRRALVDSFIARVLETAGRKITRTDIWTVAGYSEATDFERFQRNDKRTSKSAVANFSRVLSMEPDNFLRILNKIRSER